MLPVGIATFIIAMGVAWLLTPLAIRLGVALQAVDRPGLRKIHAEPVPRIGGLAVFGGFVGGLAFAASVVGGAWNVAGVDIYWRGLAYAASGMLLVGLADDLWGLSYRWKFAAQIVAATYIWTCGFRIDQVSHPGGGALELGSLSLPITVLWVVGVTNAINLIDGLDGLAGGIALITTGSVAAIAFAQGELGVTAASVALAGGLIGFLRHNINPARIFLGDSGSMFLGFVLAVTSVRGSHKGPMVVAIIAPLLVLGVPLLDTGVAVFRRTWRLGREGLESPRPLRYCLRHAGRVFEADREHIHHRLLDLGLSHRRAVAVLYTLGTVFAAASFTLVLAKSAIVALLLVASLALLLALFLGILYLRRARGADLPSTLVQEARIGPSVPDRPR